MIKSLQGKEERFVNLLQARRLCNRRVMNCLHFRLEDADSLIHDLAICLHIIYNVRGTLSCLYCSASQCLLLSQAQGVINSRLL